MRPLSRKSCNTLPSSPGAALANASPQETRMSKSSPLQSFRSYSASLASEEQDGSPFLNFDEGFASAQLAQACGGDVDGVYVLPERPAEELAEAFQMLRLCVKLESFTLLNKFVERDYYLRVHLQLGGRCEIGISETIRSPLDPSMAAKALPNVTLIDTKAQGEAGSGGLGAMICMSFDHRDTVSFPIQAVDSALAFVKIEIVGTKGCLACCKVPLDPYVLRVRSYQNEEGPPLARFRLRRELSMDGKMRPTSSVLVRSLNAHVACHSSFD
eukprot:scaffold256_cov261-Pinguiococcus_pyrenoidosus.AAC.22